MKLGNRDKLVVGVGVVSVVSILGYFGWKKYSEGKTETSSKRIRAR